MGSVSRRLVRRSQSRPVNKLSRIGAAVRPVAHALLAGAAGLAIAQSARAQVAPTNIWSATANGNWGDATNWNTNPAAPTSAATTVLEFDASGTTSYTATNDIANPFQLNGLLFNTTSSNAITLAGSDLSFVVNGAADPVLNLLSGSTGPVLINNNIGLANNLLVGGPGTGGPTTSALTLSGQLSGGGGLTLATPGSVRLTGNNSGWTGSTTINRGTLTLDFTGSNTAKLNAAGSLTFGTSIGGGGTLALIGNDSAASSQTVASTTFNPGAYTINLTSGNAQSVSLGLGALTRGSGSTVAINLTPVGGGVTALSATAPGADTVYGNVIVNGTDFAKHQMSDGAIFGLPGADYTIQNAAASWGATNANITNNAAYSGNIANGTIINTLRFNAAGTNTVALATVNDSMTISSGGILLTSASGVANINSTATNTLVGPFITTANANDLTITNNSANLFTVNANIGSGTNVPQALVKTGTGNVTIGNAAVIRTVNGIFVNQGTMNVGTSATLTAVAYNNSTYALRNPMGMTIDATPVPTPVTLGDGTTINVNFGTSAALTTTFGNTIRVPQGTATFNGTITGTAAQVLNMGGITLGDGARLISVAGGSSRYVYTGNVTVTGGAAGQPTSATISASGGFTTFTGQLVGTTGAGSSLLFNGGTDNTFTPASAAPTSISAITLANNTRFFIGNANSLAGSAPVVNIGSGSSLMSQVGATITLAQQVNIASGGAIGTRTNTLQLNNLTGMPTAGTLILNNDNTVATGSVITLNSNYPALTGDVTFQFGGTRNDADSLGVTTVTGTMDLGAGTGNRTITFDHAATTSATGPASNLFVVTGAIGMNSRNLIIAGDGSGTLNNINGGATNTLTKDTTGILVLSGTTGNYGGGTTLNTGITTIGASSAVASGAMTGGPVGTGLLTLAAGTTLRDNNAARALHNSVEVNGSVTLASTSTSGSLRFDDAGLTTPSTFTIDAAANPTLTVTNTTTISQAMAVTGGADGFIKAGAGTLIIDGDYIDTGTVTVNGGILVLTQNATTSANFIVNAATIRVEGSSAAFNNADNKVTLNNGATATRGSGVSLAEFNEWLGTTGATDIIVAISANSDDAFDFTGNAGRRLGAVSGGFIFTGTLTPEANTYKMGGGGGNIYNLSALTGGRSLDAGLGGSAVGELVLLNTNNTFTGGTTISSASALGFKTGASLSSGPVTFGAAGSTLAPLNATTISNALVTTANGTVDNRGNNVTLSGGASGAGTLTLTGRGTTTIATNPIAAGTPVIASAGSVTTALTGAPLGGANFTQHGNVNLTTGGAVTNTIAGDSANTFTYHAGTLGLGASGSPGATVTLGGTGSSFVRGSYSIATPASTVNGLLVLAPANGTANLGTASGETIKVGGTAPTLTNGIVPSIFGRDSDANGTGALLTYDGTNGFQPAALTSFAGGAFTSAGATTNYDFNTAVATVSAAQTVNALRTNQTINIDVASTGNIALTVGNATGASTLVLNGGATIAKTGAGTGQGQLAFTAPEGGKIYTSAEGSTISAVITGAGLNIAGPGALTLSGLNLFTGPLVVNGGTLAFAGYTDTTTTTTGTPQGAGGNRVTVLNGGGTLRLNSGTFNPVGGGRFTQIGAGGGVFDVRGSTFTLDDANQVASVAGTAGTLFITNSSTGNGLVAMSNQTFALNGPIVVGSATGTATFQYGNNNATTITSTLGDSLASALTLNSGGIFDMRTATPWTRPIILNGGSITTGAAPGGIITAAIYSQGGGTLNNANALTLNGEVILESAGLTLSGAGVLTLNQPIVEIASGQTLTVNKGVTVGTNILGGDPAIGHNDYNVVKTGAGTLILSGPQSFNGGLTITGTGITNIVDVNDPMAAGGTSTTYRNISLNGGRVAFRSDTNDTTFFNNISVDATGGTASAANIVIARVTSGVAAPLFNLNIGTITFNGNFALGADENNFSAASPYQLTTTGVVLNGNGIFDFGAGNGVTNSGRLLVNGPISETGGPRTITFDNTKTGDSAMIATLTNASTYSGNTIINRGIVNVQNAAALGTGPEVVFGNAVAALETQLDANTTFTQDLTVNTNAAVRVGRLTAGNGVVSTFDDVTIAAATLTVGPGTTNVNTDTPYGLTVDAITLTGAANFAVNNNGAGVGTLSATSITGAFGITKAGAGTLNVASNVTTGSPLTVSGGTFNLNGAGANTFTTGTGSGTSTLDTTATGSVEFSGAVTVGANTAASLTLGADTSFVMNSAASNFIVGNRTSVGANINDLFDATNARNLSITANTVQIGTASGAPDHTGTGPFVTFTLPTGPTSTATISAATSINLGLGENNGAGLVTMNLGGGANTINTPLISLGEDKTGARFGFPTGSAGGLTIQESGGDGKTNLLIGDNPSGATGTTPASVFELNTTGVVAATLGDITLVSTNNNTNNVTGTQGTFTMAASGIGSLVTADQVIVGVNTSGTATARTTSTFNISAGTFQFNTGGGAGFVPGSGTVTTRVMNINVSGGTFDVNGKTIPDIGTSTLTVTGGLVQNAAQIGNLDNLNFSGGTLRDILAINRNLTQTNTSAASLLDVAGADTTITGNYTLTSGQVKVAATRMLTITGTSSVGNGGIAQVDGTLANASVLAVNTGGRLQGVGSAGPVDVLGGTIAPGNSVGLLTTGNETWAAGGNYEWELANAAATGGTLAADPGAGIGWDLLELNANVLTVSATNVDSTTKFTVKILRSGSALGSFTDQWFTIAHLGSATGIDNFDTSNFILDDTLLGPGQSWSMQLISDGGAGQLLQVQAVPEPASLGLLGMAGLGLLRRRRRR